MTTGKERAMASCEHRYTVFFEPAEEGGLVVTCPALPGLVTEGDTFEDARTMAADAIRGYLESLVKDGMPLPPDNPRLSLRSIVRQAGISVSELAGFL
jgi:predicted RNase H-like HicB family nuclease